MGANFNIDTNYEDISQECYSKIDIKKHISCHSELANKLKIILPLKDLIFSMKSQ